MHVPKKASLAERIKQTRPFGSFEEEAYLSILRTAFELSHRGDQFLRQANVSQSQYNVLRILQGAGETGLARNEIAARMISPMPDVSRLLDRMEKVGWITRKRNFDDRRQVTTCITEDGRAILTRLKEPLYDFLKNQFRHMSPERVRLLIELLEEVRETE